MYVVTVTLPGSFPFNDGEVFANPDLAVERAREWIAWGGAEEVEVTDEASWTARNAWTVATATGLGLALGLIDLTDATNDTLEVAA